MLKDRIFLGLLLWAALLVGLTIFDSSLASPNRKIGSEPSEQRSADQQQEESWADRAIEPISLITLALVIVGAVQVRLFYWQLDLIRESLRDAQKSADASAEAAKAATAQAKVAQDTFAELERPWIFVTPADDLYLRPGVVNPFARFDIANHGRSPAIIQRAIFFLGYGATGPENGQENRQLPSGIGPNKELARIEYRGDVGDFDVVLFRVVDAGTQLVAPTDQTQFFFFAVRIF